tara:strand:+ start:544 stop:990 length:447 start_codon:yes stop_codon:yes gene_type:complete
MILSKKEVSIIIEIGFSILFAIFFLPYFFENRLNSIEFTGEMSFLSEVWVKIIQMIVFSIIYYSISYTLLEIIYKEKIIKDERDDMISSKSYRLGFRLYEYSLFMLIGILLSNASIQNSGSIMFFILILLLSVLLIKSIYQLYLYRTS